MTLPIADLNQLASKVTPQPGADIEGESLLIATSAASQRDREPNGSIFLSDINRRKEEFEYDVV